MTKRVDELHDLVGDRVEPIAEAAPEAEPRPTTLSRIEVKTVDRAGQPVTIRFVGERLTWTDSVEVYRHQDGRLVVIDLQADRRGWALLKSADDVPAFLAQADQRYAVPLYEAQRKLGHDVVIDL